MCLALPGKILTLRDDEHAQVDFGGARKDINVTLVKAKVGDWVVVHAGFAISIISEQDAASVYRDLGIK